MKTGLQLLSGMIGSVVQAVVIRVVFFGVEQNGEFGDVSISFSDGSIFSLGCAGDGSIFVLRTDKTIGDAPFTHTATYNLQIGGCKLIDTVFEESRLKLQIGEVSFVLDNLDDQLTISVGGEELRESSFPRT